MKSVGPSRSLCDVPSTSRPDEARRWTRRLNAARTKRVRPGEPPGASLARAPLPLPDLWPDLRGDEGTLFSRGQMAVEQIRLVLTRKARGGPLPAIVVAFGFDEWTVAALPEASEGGRSRPAGARASGAAGDARSGARASRRIGGQRGRRAGLDGAGLVYRGTALVARAEVQIIRGSQAGRRADGGHRPLAGHRPPGRCSWRRRARPPGASACRPCS